MFNIETLNNKKLNILGTNWIIKIVDNLIDDCYGMCDKSINTIFIRRNAYLEYSDSSSIEKLTVRHEILHVFFIESGLDECSETSAHWAINEEMVDWFAIQSPKIYKVYSMLNIL